MMLSNLAVLKGALWCTAINVTQMNQSYVRVVVYYFWLLETGLLFFPSSIAFDGNMSGRIGNLYKDRKRQTKEDKTK